MNTGHPESTFNKTVLAAPGRVALPIAVYPGLALTGGRVLDVVTNAAAQVDAQAALQERYRTAFALSAMDLSAEAEAFGCSVHFSEDEVPTVAGRLVTDLAGARRLAVPEPGDKRTAVYLDAVRGLRRLAGNPLVFGGCIGPFSLATRLVGVSEAMELSVTAPQMMHAVIAKSAAFLTAYVHAFREAGAAGVIMAEPVAGLLSPRALAGFSSAYIKELAEAVSDGRFTLILHNCAAKLPHLAALLASGLRSFHFGAPMDMAAALATVASDVVICGNLDPAAVFCHSTPDRVRQATADLLAKTRSFPNVVISSGCDLPPSVTLDRLDAFHQTVVSAEMALRS